MQTPDPLEPVSSDGTDPAVTPDSKVPSSVMLVVCVKLMLSVTSGGSSITSISTDRELDSTSGRGKVCPAVDLK